MKFFRLTVFLFFIVIQSYGQLLDDYQNFSRKDTLRGALSSERTCYDVYYYDLDVKIDPTEKSLEGSNTVYFTVTENTGKIQIDLFENMDIDSVLLDKKTRLSFVREYDAVFIDFPEALVTESNHTLTIFYKGKPITAKNPPWDGGFTWAIDSAGNPWIAVTCQGTGASLWWPNKDHQSDEPDSMMIRVTVPEGLEDISNGRLISVQNKTDWTTYNWFVSYPINNYNVTVNIGNYAHFDELYIDEAGDTLTMDYYVLPQDLEKAKRQFTQTTSMMDFFYKYFGPYPFIDDGYKLIQSPHLGMEHQSAVAYGNGFLNGYKGTGSSKPGIKFDFIILHETAHEWWGNNITTNDVADMWVHESFGAYSEGLYVEYMFGYKEAMDYINGKKQNVKNDRPIIGTFGLNSEGSSDMYDKGQLALNTLRHVIDNDSLWFGILKELNTEFRYQTIDGQQVFDFINDKTGMDLDYFYEQYFRQSELPVLEVKITKKSDSVHADYRWKNVVGDFSMPIEVTTGPGLWEIIYPTTAVQSMDLNGLNPKDFQIAEDQYYVDVDIWKTYVDPRKKND